MARGVAVVAVDSGGPADFIEQRRTGMLARSGEPAALADAVQELLASPELRAQVAAAGRERFMLEFTTEAMARRFFAALEAVHARRGERR
jgi:glycosyltransferase involved in cell wall biosynthesis